MSSIADFFGVAENRAFTLKKTDTKYMIMNGTLYFNNQRSRRDDDWEMVHIVDFYRVAGKLDEITLLPPAPVYKTKIKLAAVKFVLPCFNYVAADQDGTVCLYEYEPELQTTGSFAMKSSKRALCLEGNLKVFEDGEITHEMGPIYYGDLRMKREVL